MKRLIGSTFVIAALLMIYTHPATAHHSHAMFDHTVEVTVTGTVTSFSYRNPHVFLYLDVKDENGAIVQWAVEMSNITNMVRQGVHKSTFNTGDVVTVTMNPLKDGRPGGNYTQAIAADGSAYPVSDSD